MLLAPDRLCRRVREIDADLPLIVWEELLQDLRGLRSVSTLTTHAIRHFEDQMEHPPGINKPMTLADFEEATTTVACLKQFLMDCVAELKGSVHGEPLYMTPGDGRPRSGGGWAWHGFAVPDGGHFTRAIGLSKRFTQRGLRRTFNDLTRAAQVEGVVTKSISGHLTERMRERYSTVAPIEQRASIARVIDFAQAKPATNSGDAVPSNGEHAPSGEHAPQSGEHQEKTG